jgi:thiol-disulfide isomerase/thioredoxin
MRLLRCLALLLAPVALALSSEKQFDPVEERVAALVAAPEVTVVHFWAPWCPNCRAEMGPEGWAKFIGANPEVKFVFLNIWHRGQDPARALRESGLGPQTNLELITHSNPSSAQADRLKTFLGLPITWIPTTWVFRDGRLRFALNYGEVRFDMLQTMIDDSREAWRH